MTVPARIACILILLSLTGCATLVYPKRSGLPREKRGAIDWSMVQMDVMFTGGIGLLIDFIHGTIYCPVKGYSGRGYDPGLFTSSEPPKGPAP